MHFLGYGNGINTQSSPYPCSLYTIKQYHARYYEIWDGYELYAEMDVMRNIRSYAGVLNFLAVRGIVKKSPWWEMHSHILETSNVFRRRGW